MATDSELLEAWRAGEASAGERLFRRHFDAVARFFRNKVTADLEDLIQQTFLGCVEGRSRFRGEGSFRGYLFGVAHRVLGTYLRRKYRDGAKIDVDEVSMHDLAPGPSQMLARQREHALLLLALRQISIVHQVTLELYFWEGMTAAEIAEALAIPLGTALTRLRRGRELLAGRYEQLASAAGLAPEPPDFDAWARALRQPAAT